TTPAIDSRTPRSTEPLFPVMPMAVRKEPGIGWALRPRLSIRSHTARICASVACDCMTINIEDVFSLVARGVYFSGGCGGKWPPTPSPCFTKLYHSKRDRRIPQPLGLVLRLCH